MTAGLRRVPEWGAQSAGPRRRRTYLFSAALVAVASGLGLLIRGMVAPSNLVMLFLLVVVIAALRWGQGPAVLTAVLGVVAFDFFFVPPHLTLAVSDSQYLLTFLGLLVVGLVISRLAAQAREQAEAAERRAADTLALYRLSRDLAAGGDDLPRILQVVITYVGQTFAREAAVLLPEATALTVAGKSPGFELSSAEMSLAQNAFASGEPTGRGTAQAPQAEARYLPLKTARGTLGVLAVRPIDPTLPLSEEQRRLLQAFASQAALGIEHVQLADSAAKAQLLEATERLQTALLNSISHDMRSPLASITGVLSSLRDEEVQLDDATRASLIDDAYQEAERLNRVLGNLLNMSRLEGAALRVVKVPGEIQDLVGAALAQMGARLAQHPIKIDIPNDLPLVPMDLSLMVQVLVNVLDNAAKYSEPGSPIDVTAGFRDRVVQVEVADRGIGIPEADLRRVFDKFYRVQRRADVRGPNRQAKWPAQASGCQSVRASSKRMVGRLRRAAGRAEARASSSRFLCRKQTGRGADYG